MSKQQITKGIDKPHKPNASAGLLAEAAQSAPDARVALYGGAELAATLAARVPAGALRATSTRFVELEAMRRLFTRYNHANASAEVALPDDADGTFDMAVIDAPQSRVLARRWLLEAWSALRVGGTLYLGGANDLGIQSLIGDAAALFGSCHTLLTKRHSRVGQSRRLEDHEVPGWASDAGIARGSWYEFSVNLPDGSLALSSIPGVFSYDRLDAGTALLLEQLGSLNNARVLDLGCGYGVIGLVAARRGAAAVDMIDENLYAIASAKRNIAAHNMKQVRAFAGNVRAGELKSGYDLVITNPPFHQGKAVDYRVANDFMTYARDMLTERGRFVLVANSFLRYDRTLAEHFPRVEQVARTASYTVWQAWKS